ncbi:hypothetical protein CsatA_024583 [Cannabis sativa]
MVLPAQSRTDQLRPSMAPTDFTILKTIRSVSPTYFLYPCGILLSVLLYAKCEGDMGEFDRILGLAEIWSSTGPLWFDFFYWMYYRFLCSSLRIF